MGDSASAEVPLPLSVERLIGKICFDQVQPRPDTKARTILASIGEDSSIHMLGKISKTRIKTLSGFIKYLAKDYPPVTAAAESIFLSPHKRPSTSVSSVGTDDYIFHSAFPEHLLHSSASSLERTNSPTATHFSPSSSSERASTPIATHYSPSSSLRRTSTPIETHSLFSPSSNSERSNTPIAKRLVFSPSSSSVRGSTATISQQWLILIELEFRKAFLVLNYIGRKKLEDVISFDDALNILRMKDYPMAFFEAQIWSNYGRYCLVGKESTDRRKYLDWDSGRTHHYYCQVYQDGSYSFTGPYLNTAKTLLHRTLGDENVLMVKFEEQPMSSTNFAMCSTSYNAAYIKIAEEGILIGQRRYRFFGESPVLLNVPSFENALLLS